MVGFLLSFSVLRQPCGAYPEFVVPCGRVPVRSHLHGLDIPTHVVVCGRNGPRMDSSRCFHAARGSTIDSHGALTRSNRHVSGCNKFGTVSTFLSSPVRLDLIAGGEWTSKLELNFSLVMLFSTVG